MADRLDCNTPKGRVAIARQHEILGRCAAAWHCEHAVTADTGEARVDAVFVRDGVVIAVGEVKARELTVDQLAGFEERPGYVVTAKKLDEGRAVAQALRVPYLLIVGFYPEARVMWWQLTDAAGGWRFGFERAVTQTRATVNGGNVTRLNAYLPLGEMNELTEPAFVDPVRLLETQAPATATGEMPDADDLRWSMHT